MSLSRHDELCLYESTHALGHLAQLRELGVAADRREGVWVYYRIDPPLPDWAMDVPRDTAMGMSNWLPFVAEEQALACTAHRPRSARCA